MNQMGELRNVLTLLGKNISEIKSEQQKTHEKLLILQDNFNIFKEIQYNQKCDEIWENDIKKINSLFYPYQSDFSNIMDSPDKHIMSNNHLELLFRETDAE